MLKLNKNVKLRFINDFNLSISVVEDEYFDYYIDLYDNHYETKKKKQLLIDTIKKYIPDGVELTDESWDAAQEAFLTDFYDTRDNILQSMLDTDAYKSFISDENPIFREKAELDVYGCQFTKRKEIYTVENAGKFFISLDFKKANFNALKEYDSNIIFNADTYEDMIRKFTDLEYIIDSKHIREYIFGKLNHPRQSKLEQIRTSKLLKLLLDENKFNKESLSLFVDDELVFVSDSLLPVEECEKLSSWIKEELGYDIRVESFELKRIKDFNYYVKRCSTGENIFKKVPSFYFPQIYKYFYSLELNEKDLAFYYEKRLAKFVEPIV